jgi:uridine kinase
MALPDNHTLWVEIAGTRTPLVAGQSIWDVLRASGGEDIWGEDPVVLATVNGRRAHLLERLWGGERVQLIRLSDGEAHSTMVRTLCAVAAAAAGDLFPERRLVVDFSYGNGLYCELRGPPGADREVTPEQLAGLAGRMREIAARALSLEPRVYGLRELLAILRASRRDYAIRSARYIRQEAVTLYQLNGSGLHFYGLQLPTTAGVRSFDLRAEPPGFVLLPSLPGRPDQVTEMVPQPKLLESLRGYSRYAEQLGFPDIGSINEVVVNGQAGELIQVEEARHASVVVEAAARVAGLPEEGRLVLVAGPSSSGKTSFAKRLALQLRVLGLAPVALSLDDYFVPRELTPRDADGELDYEALAAIQVDLFNQHLQALLAGESVRLPRYDFTTGTSSLRTEGLTVARGQPLIVEGIHALDPDLTPGVAARHKLRIYVSALTHLNIDELSYIPTHLTRLYRRIVRDARYRGYTASATLARWPKVRAGEQKWVFPFQQNADLFFNAGLAYELNVLKLWAEPRLAAVEPDDPNYGRARSLVETLTLLLPIDAGQVPPTSLLREFIGGSGFRY